MDDVVLYRTEALATLEWMSDVIVEVRAIRAILESYGEEDEEDEEDDGLGE